MKKEKSASSVPSEKKEENFGKTNPGKTKSVKAKQEKTKQDKVIREKDFGASYRLSPDEVRFRISLPPERNAPKKFDWSVFHPQAVEALKMGLRIRDPHYHIMLCGRPGTGRLKMLEDILNEYPPAPEKKAEDLFYLYNFDKPFKPVLLTLPSEKFAGDRLRAFLLKSGELLQKEEKENFESSFLRLFREEEASWEGASPVLRYLSGVQKAVLKDFLFFKKKGDPDILRRRYGPQELFSGRGREAVPILTEEDPTAEKLLGTAVSFFFSEEDRERDRISWKIVPGAFHKSYGGVLILRFNPPGENKMLWSRLKQALLGRQVSPVSVSGVSPAFGAFAEPEPFFHGTKVLLIAEEGSYDELASGDPDFLKIFKVCSECNTAVSRTPAVLEQYRNMVGELASDLAPLTAGGLREVCREAVSRAEDRIKISTARGPVRDLLLEAEHWRKKSGKPAVDTETIRTSVRKRRDFSALWESEINEDIRRGVMIIHVDGTAQGCMNGLALLERGGSAFGSPIRITASVSHGKEGIINIEKEAGLSGEIHDKGVLILEGYLRKKYAGKQALNIYASLCVEQSYYEIEGDSASLAELYTLLSAIGEIPMRQDLAVSGSVNQLGEIQPVGGISQKVEGFYKVCRKLGLTGRQGVIIPAGNKDELILSHRTEKAVEKGEFSVYAIENADEGLEILSGRKAGTPNARGLYPPRTLNRIISDKLKKLSETSD